MALIYLSFLLTLIVCCCATDGKSDARSNEEERATFYIVHSRPSHVLRAYRNPRIAIGYVRDAAI